MSRHCEKPGTVDYSEVENPDIARLAEGLCDCDLQAQNAEFAGTGGVSRNNRELGFVPGYLNTGTGKTLASRFSDGRPAPIHVLDGLPDSWIGARDASGKVTRAARTVVAGFLRNGEFFTRASAASAKARDHG